MAYKLETTIRRYIGLSSDRKPYSYPRETDEEKPSEGSTFLAADTQVMYRWTNDAWIPQSPERSDQYIDAIGKQPTKAARGAVGAMGKRISTYRGRFG